MRTGTASDFRIVFANAFRVRIGDNDCALSFVVETDDLQGQIQIDQVQVACTPRTLKLMHHAITLGLKRLEAATGPIELPPDKIEGLEKAFGMSLELK
jgi:hypothetical protein